MKLWKPLITAAGLTVMTASLVGCGSTTIAYTSAQSVDTTSLNFSSTDLQTTATKMVDSMLSSPAVVKLTAKTQPAMFIGSMNNNTNEHINTQQITNAVSTRLIQSGKFRFIAMSQVKAVEKQYNYQQNSGYVDPKTAVAVGKQVGAQYMLYGDISNITASNDSQTSQYFMVTMKLVDLQSNVIVWQGEKQIRKVAKRHTFGW